MVAVKIWGGLGNQMFQYAFGIHLSRQLGKRLYFYVVEDKLLKNKIDILNYNVDMHFLKEKEISKFMVLNGNGLYYRIERKILQKFPNININLFIEPSLNYNSIINNASTLYDGYWQSYKYIQNIEVIIKSHLKLKENLIPCLHLENDVKNKNSISLHIRRGDYLEKGFKNKYAYCDEKYYYNAIKLIIKTVDNPIFYVFSNELDWVKTNFEIFKEVNVEFVDNSNYNNAHLLDLYLMTHCKHNIIANSTFSWWGAWLNNNKDKVIIAPKQWYNGDLNNTTVDLIPPTWIRI